MIVGAYQLDLYCENSGDNVGEDEIHEFDEFPHIYVDEEGSVCRSRARQDGWILNLEKGTAICPKCSGKKNG